MGVRSSIKGILVATWSGLRHLFHPRMTLRYPEQKLDLEGPGYRYDPRQGVGLPGFKGRHILYMDKCTGCQLCAIACDGIAVAIEMQQIQKGKPQNKRQIWPAVDYGRCVPPSTPIITIDGVKPMSEIRVGDRVLTHTGKFRKVTRLFSRSYTGKLYTFRTLGNFESLTTTEDHPILTWDDKGISWKFANEIKYRTYLTQPVLAEELQTSEIQFNYELYYPAGRGGSFTTELVSLQATPELMRLVGYYLAEGTSDRYRVSFDINKKEENLEADIISSVAKVFGEPVSVKPDPDSEGLKLVVDSVKVASFFSQFGHYRDAKQLPWWMVLLPRANIEGIVRGEFLGDGHYSDKYYQCKTAMHSNYFTTRTTSKTLALQMHFMLGRLGIVSSISTQWQKDRKLCYSVTVHTPYIEVMGALVGVPAENNEVSHSYVHLRDGMIIAPVVKIETQEVKDFLVRNIEVEEDNSYVAANISVHNCVFCGLCIEPETEVATNPGLKQINQLAVGDMVLTHSGEYKPVTRVWDMTYAGPYYRIHVFGKPEPLMCTADHPIMAVSRPISKRRDRRLLRVKTPLLFHKPGELKVGDYLVSPIVRKVVHIDRFEKNVPMYRGGASTRLLSVEASPELFRLIGYYYAEGSCSEGRTVHFDFNATERDTYARDCGDLVAKFFRKACRITKNGESGIRLVLNSALAEDFFSQFGNGAPNKKMPDWVFFAEPEKQLELLKGEWQGDGCKVKQPRQKYLNITTTSKTLAFQIQSVYARLGIVATIDSKQSPGKLRCYHVSVFGRWAIRLAKMWNVKFDYRPTKHADKFHIDDKFVYLPVRRIEVEEVRDHHVMDVTVEGDHTFAPLGLATSNCVDACPFDALYMTNDYELAAYDKMSLKYTPDMLAVPPKLEGRKYKVKFDTEKGTASHG
jgi:formate hydrogenlyase subunit 6/NADH:ubiquinone oxidoreductase subunit I/intein/homing endonuclease